MSFCRITGRSRNLPKPHYFPLIPPMSPADAQRICKITGKSIGLPQHHYVPVLLRKSQPLAKCRITKTADGKRKHNPINGFKYLRPIIDPKLKKILKKPEGLEGEFVYPVTERKLSLMFPAQLEFSIRSGDIKDVMMAEDQVLLKMKIGEDISLPVRQIPANEYLNKELFEGEGIAEEEVVEEVKPVIEKVKKEKKVKNQSSVIVSGDDWRDLIQPLLEGCDWKTFEDEAAKGMLTAKWTPGDNRARCSNDFNPNQKMLPPLLLIQNGISQLSPNDLEHTTNIFQKLIDGGKHTLEKLPLITELQQIVQKLSSGTQSELATIPGMNLFTDKPRFVIGQMVNTPTGKIFVPGQTVNSNFVPGFVVNTTKGPALVPGVILSKQKHSAYFLPGENILIDTETGQYDFITEQKMILCKTLDEEQFKILGDFVEHSTPDFEHVSDLAKMVAVKYDFEDHDLENLTKLILLVTHFAQQKPGHEFGDGKWEEKVEDRINLDILKNALLTSVGLIHDNNPLELIFNGLTEIFANLDNKSKVIKDLCQFLNTQNCEQIFNEILQQNNHKLPNSSKIDILNSALGVNMTQQQIIEKLSTVIEEDLLAPAFRNISKDNPEFLSQVLQTVKKQQAEITSEQSAYEILQIAIVDAIKDISELKLGNFLKNAEDQAIKELLSEAIGLAVALGMQDTANSLLKVISDPQSINLISDDPLTLEILKRLTVMRQIAEKQPQLLGALSELKRNPHNARSDPKLRELVRESAVLMVPDVPNLKTSDHIPTHLFSEPLAMEDFVTRNRQPGTVMIIKRGLQAVVPKEAARAVLNGQVAYTLIDEKGIRYFKPMDVFSALGLSKPTVKRFSGYECLGACERNKELTNAAKVKDFTNRLLACF